MRGPRRIDIEAETTAFIGRVVSELEAEVSTHRQQVENLTRSVAYWQNEAALRTADMERMRGDIAEWARRHSPSDSCWDTSCDVLAKYAGHTQ